MKEGYAMDQERYESNEMTESRATVIERTKEAAQNKVHDAKEALEAAGTRVRDVAVENPMSMLLAGMAVGFLIGMMLPVSRFESERIGPMTEEVKDRVREAGGEMMRRGSEVIKDTIEGTKEAAKASIRAQTAEMAPDDTSGMT